MTGRARVNRVCRHCGREGVRGFVHVLHMDGSDAGYVCDNGNACLRRCLAIAKAAR